ncbi:hypothetical protein [Streptomyces finlayi]|uniref:hypothetical protein n=1 Tax=Streptomyces finlayi TaxID=67296 RepID=UPI001675E8A9|nr:hypothetical protein [Streptomyces finlayi]
MAELLEQLGDDQYLFESADDLWFLVKCVQAAGVLLEVSIFPLVPVGGLADDPFLVGVEVASDVVVTSEPFQWQVVAPPAGCCGAAAVLHLLAELEAVVGDLHRFFEACF